MPFRRYLFIGNGNFIYICPYRSDGGFRCFLQFHQGGKDLTTEVRQELELLEDTAFGETEKELLSLFEHFRQEGK